MKKSSVANFNLVFYGKDEEPLLAYFDSILMPALTSGIKREIGDAKYFLMNVGVEETEEGEYVLRGLIIKQTVLEVKSDLDENGKLIEKDEKYPTAPFSTFVIYLKNHRMLYVENQKGSPSLKNFKATMKYLLDTYVKKKMQDGDEELPIPILNVVGIPMHKRLQQALEEVEKINLLCLRFYPLNGDLDYSGLFGGISKDIRKAADCKNADLILKSPKNIEGVINIVEKSGGTVKPIFEVTYRDKKKGKKRTGKIKDDQISESMDIDVEGETLEEEMRNIIKEGKTRPSITYTSKNNESIYEENKYKIIKFIK